MVASGRPKHGLSKTLRGMGRGNNWHFSFLAAPSGKAWAVLRSPCLGLWAALATGRLRRWTHNTLQCERAGSVHYSTGQHGAGEIWSEA